MYGTDSNASQLSQFGQSAARPMPELGRLKAASERVAVLNNRVVNFIDRFHGPMPEAASTGIVDKSADSYRNDLESLFIQIERLESAVSSLDSIG